MLHPSIKTFLKVADCGSFSAASEKLYVSKVSVMNQINALEAQIGVSLLERTNHGVTLTAAGKSLYDNGAKLLRLSEEAVREARHIGGAVSQTIRIGTSMMRPCNSLVELWERIHPDGQEYQFSIVPFNDDTDSLSAMLNALGNKIDCFVTPCGSMALTMNYSFLPFQACPCAVAMSKKHPFAKKAVLTWDDLDGESLLLIKCGESYIVDAIRDDIIREHPGIQVIDFDRYYDISTFNLCEQKGYLMETIGIWAGLHPSLVTIPVDWKYEMPYGILYAKKPSDVVKSFIDMIAKAIEYE